MRRFRYFVRGRGLPVALLFLLTVAAGIALAIRLPRLLAPVALMERALSFIAAAVLLALRDIPERKIAKLVLLCFLPWMGFILVLFFAEADPPAPSTANCGRGGGDLLSRTATLAERFSGARAAAGTLGYFASGEEMRRALCADLKGAKRRIFLEYYIIAEGKFWGEIVALLEERAKAGVDVRVIFDDFGCALTLPRGYAKELGGRGIAAKVFRRLRLGWGLTRRDHRKIFLIDDICYTGGINLADEYVGERIRFGHWKDSAVRVEGDVSAFEDLFLRTWYGPSRSKRKKTPPILPKREGAEEGSFVVLSDGTQARERMGAALLPLLFGSAERTLLLSSPYLSLPHGMLGLLGSAAAAGVDVRVLIPHIPDKRAVFFLTRAYARELMRMGVKVREYTPGFMHAKSIVIDGKYALVSSYNLDFRSLYVQAECGVFAEDRALANAVGQDLLACFEGGCDVKKAGPFVRILGRLCMLFAPLT